MRRWRPALAGHPAERRPPNRRRPLPRGGKGKSLLLAISGYLPEPLISRLCRKPTRTCQSPVDARHPDPGRVVVGPGQGGLCQAAWLTVTVKPLADPEKVRLIRRYGRLSGAGRQGSLARRTSIPSRRRADRARGPLAVCTRTDHLGGSTHPNLRPSCQSWVHLLRENRVGKPFATDPARRLRSVRVRW
jgi:hypothetical protein